ncbi:MAG: hypothetical protein JO131_07395 [Gammaproteobacteria bacterium]|nr:hypothetical protein [Gammaproteobacteria bacterium]
MRILITSGGTKIPIDPVRSITNHSTGKFGADIARAALEANMDVIYLTSFEGISPFTKCFNYQTLETISLEKNILALKNLYSFSKKFSKKYIEYRYNDYNDYAYFLKKIIGSEKPDAVVLAAAVSDYIIENYSQDKIRSNENLSLTLKQAPKLIKTVREYLPDTILVGFKLLVNATDYELITAASQSIKMNNANFIVANDLTSIKKGIHEIIIVNPNGTHEKITQDLAKKIIERILREQQILRDNK